MRAREEHYERCFGECKELFHSVDFVNSSLFPTKPHIDVYPFPPTEQRPYWTLVTGGMSDWAQPIASDLQEELELSPLTEVLMYTTAPEEWAAWVLKRLAEFPFTRKEYVHWFHTVPIGGAPTEGTELSAILTVPCERESDEFNGFELEGVPVDFLHAVPIFERELEFARKEGSAALYERLQATDALGTVDLRRASVT